MSTLKTPIDTTLLRKLNIVAAARGLTVNAAVNEAMRLWVERNQHVVEDTMRVSSVRRPSQQ